MLKQEESPVMFPKAKTEFLLKENELEELRVYDLGFIQK